MKHSEDVEALEKCSMEAQQMNAEVKLTNEKVIGAQLREKPLKSEVNEIYEQFC